MRISHPLTPAKPRDEYSKRVFERHVSVDSTVRLARPAVCLGREERDSPPLWIKFRGIPWVSRRCTA